MNSTPLIQTTCRDVFQKLSVSLKDPKEEYRKDPTDVKTPSGYDFRLVAKKLNWYQALQECGSDGGHLVSVHNETTNRDMALVAQRDGFPLWTGLSRLDVSKQV